MTRHIRYTRWGGHVDRTVQLSVAGLLDKSDHVYLSANVGASVISNPNSAGVGRAGAVILLRTSFDGINAERTFLCVMHVRHGVRERLQLLSVDVENCSSKDFVRCIDMSSLYECFEG